MANLKNGKPKIIAIYTTDNIDYDYPSCGGIEVSIRLLSTGRCYARQSQWSNYQGCISGRRYMADITGTQTHALLMAVILGLTAPDGGEYDCPAEHRLQVIGQSEMGIEQDAIRCLARGYKVQ